jgi:WD40 repeat protein
LRKKALKYKRQVGIAAAILLIVFGTVLVAYTKIVGQQAVLRATEERNKSLETELADLRTAILSGDQDVAEAALRVLEDKYLDSQQKVEELLQKLDQQATPVATKRIDLRQGEPLSPTALVRQPALPDGVQSWSLETIGHRGQITKVAYSPNNRLFASCSLDGTIRLWDSDSGELMRILVNPSGAVNDLIWSPDSKSLMSVGRDSDHQICSWAIDSGKMLTSVSLAESWMKCPAWSPDGRFLAFSLGDSISLWHFDTGQIDRTLEGHRDKIGQIVWSQDGRRLASVAKDGSVIVWDPLADRIVRRFDSLPDVFVSLAWSPDSRMLAGLCKGGSSANLHTIKLWDAVSGNVLTSIEFEKEVEGTFTYPVSNLAWTKDGNALACTVKNKIIVWDTQSAGVRQLQLSFSPVHALTWSSDGRVLALGNEEGQLRFWDVVAGQIKCSHRSYSHGTLSSVRFSPDGKLLASGGFRGTVCLWDAYKWQSLYKSQAYGVTDSPYPGGTVLAWSIDSTALAIGNVNENHLVILDAQSGTASDIVNENQSPICSIAFSPDGTRLATGHLNGTLHLWDVVSRPYKLLRSIDAHAAELSALVWTLDGRGLLSSGHDGMIKLWKPETQELVRDFDDHTAPVLCLAISPDGKTFASGSKDETIRLWNAQSSRPGHILRDTSSTSGGKKDAVAWSPDGATLASGSSDGTLQIWNPESGQLLYGVEAHCGHISSLAWSPDGQFLVCSGLNGTARVWDVKNNFQHYTVLLPLWGSSGPGMAINPQGDYRGPPGIEEHLIYVVQTDGGQELLTPRDFANRYGWINEPWQVGLHTPGSETMERIYVKADAQGSYDGNSWNTAFNDLQDALNVAQPNTEIWVAAGVYRPDRGTGMREASFRLRNGVCLLGGFSGTEANRYQRDPNNRETILSGDLNGDDGPDFANIDENSYHVISARESVKNAVLDGFTIRGGNANGPQEDGHGNGGGMFNDRGHCALINCTFIRNRSDLAGGGISSWGTLAISNCAFSDNLTRGRGGGLWCSGNDTSVLTECIFAGNKAHDHGGGVAHRGQAGAIFIGCRFVGNSAPDSGGLHTQGSFYTQPILVNCVFYANVASEVAGGMTNRGTSPALANCVFAGNSAGGYAGAMHSLQNASPVLTNCTFVGNSAPANSGGVFHGDDCSPAFTNCVFWANTCDGDSIEYAQINGGGLINYCCIQGWSGKLGGTGNFGDDPLFVDPDGSDNRIGTLDDNLRLRPNSPCINAGDNSALAVDVSDLDSDGDTEEPIPFDIEGQSRVLNGTVDIGGYESG